MEVLRLEFYEGSLKAHCTQCDEDSVFRTDRIQSGELEPTTRHSAVFRNAAGHGQTLTAFSHFRAPLPEKEIYSYAESDRCFTVQFYCTREHAHRIYFTFAVRDKTIQKVGQFPSLSDFQGAAAAHYKKLLPKDLAAAYTKAVNLHSHDVGAGAFVYLRRIFEHLVEEAHKKAMGEPSWDEDAYQKQRVVERIKALHRFLPEYMVQEAGAYSVLSRGVHELSEDECTEYFPVIRGAIELILEERYAEKQRELRKADISNAMAQIRRR